jgi:hypothetical protein
MFPSAGDFWGTMIMAGFAPMFIGFAIVWLSIREVLNNAVEGLGFFMAGFTAAVATFGAHITPRTSPFTWAWIGIMAFGVIFLYLSLYGVPHPSLPVRRRSIRSYARAR